MSSTFSRDYLNDNPKCFFRKSTLHIGFTKYGFNLLQPCNIGGRFPKIFLQRQFAWKLMDGWWMVPYWPCSKPGKAPILSPRVQLRMKLSRQMEPWVPLLQSDPKISCYKAVISSLYTILDLVRFFCSINVCGVLGFEKHSESNAQHFRAEALMSISIFTSNAKPWPSLFSFTTRRMTTALLSKISLGCWKSQMRYWNGRKETDGIPNILPSHKLFDSCAYITTKSNIICWFSNRANPNWTLIKSVDKSMICLL